MLIFWHFETVNLQIGLTENYLTFWQFTPFPCTVCVWVSLWNAVHGVFVFQPNQYLCPYVVDKWSVCLSVCHLSWCYISLVNTNINVAGPQRSNSYGRISSPSPLKSAVYLYSIHDDSSQLLIEKVGTVELIKIVYFSIKWFCLHHFFYEFQLFDLGTNP